MSVTQGSPKGPAHDSALAKRDPSLLRAIFSDKKPKSLDEQAIRRATSSSSPSSANGIHPVTRTASSPHVSKPVGSGRLFVSSRK